MKRRERKNVSSGGFTLALLTLLVLFLISFTSASWIYIKSNKLVFSDSIKDYEEKVKKIEETEDKIAELEEQLERYKSLYESVLEDNKSLSATVVRTSEALQKAEANSNAKADKEGDKKADSKDDKEENKNDKSKDDKSDNITNAKDDKKDKEEE